jgi:cytochrome c oxidase assembly protein subunit 15
MPGSWIPSSVILLVLLAILAAGGFAVGRSTGLGAIAGGFAGALASLINLLVLGSILSDAAERSLPHVAIWLTGSILLGGLLGMLGGWLGGRSGPSSSRSNSPSFTSSSNAGEAKGKPLPSIWTSRFAWVAAAATFLLLMVGGLVTSKNAGLAVVDWPNSYGYNMFLFPMSRMTGGVYYEHSHRLMGALVGLTTVTLAAHLLRVDPRPSIRGLGVVAVLMVIGQGILGGLRVTGRFTTSTSPADTAPSLALAVVHGVFGQLFFATMIALAVFCSRGWWDAPPARPHADAIKEHRLSALLIVALVIQLVLGAFVRHTTAGLYLHLSMAVIVILLTMVVGMRASNLYPDAEKVRRTGKALVHLIGLQLLLGISALLALVFAQGSPEPPVYEVVIATAHQVTGALLLAWSVMLALWTRRLLVRA